ncbi:MAG: TauD/TfdA family dioxygenase [Acidimicrobiales bacterium]
MEIEPLTGVLGAQVHGVDLASDISSLVEDLEAAIDSHAVLVFRDQSLTPAQQVRFSRCFGPYSPDPFVDGIDNNPEVIRVVREADEGDAFNFGGAWHSDWSFQQPPPAYTTLHALDMPPRGGDTIWTDMRAVYDALPQERRELLDQLTAVHTARDAYSPKMRAMYDELKGMRILTDERACEVFHHPLIRVLPRTGRKTLFFNSGYVKELLGDDLADDEESQLRSWLHNFSTQHQFTFRHRWRDGDVVMWDNRCTQHFALPDYVGYRRELHRTTIGERATC